MFSSYSANSPLAPNHNGSENLRFSTAHSNCCSIANVLTMPSPNRTTWLSRMFNCVPVRNRASRSPVRYLCLHNQSLTCLAKQLPNVVTHISRLTNGFCGSQPLRRNSSIPPLSLNAVLVGLKLQSLPRYQLECAV